MCHRHERTCYKHLVLVTALTTTHSWLYMLMVAMDANFRLKSRLRGAINKEPALGVGWAYFVDNGPYSEFIKKFVDEDEVRAREEYPD